MATTAKNKTTTAAKKENTVKTFTTEGDSKDEVKVEEVKPVKKFEADTKVLCRSVTEGGLYCYSDKTRETYGFTDYGDENEIEYRALTSWIQSNSAYVFAPMLIVEDEDFIAQNKKLSDFYTNNADLTNLKSVLDLPVDRMKQRIETFSDDTKRAFKTVVIKAIETHDLDSMNKINILSNFYNVDFNLINEPDFDEA